MVPDQPTTHTPVRVHAPGRPYALLGTLVLLALVIVAAAGVLGVGGPGWFSTSTAFLMVGAGMVVLAAAAVAMSFSLHGTLRRLAEHEARWNQYQDERASLVTRLQRERDERQDKAAKLAEDTLRARDKRLDERIDAVVRTQETKLAQALAAEAKRFDDLLERQEADFARTMRRYEGRLEDLSARTALAAQVLQGPALDERPRPEASPFGDVHPIEDLKDLTRAQVDALHHAGINHTEALWRADPKELAERLGVPRRTVGAWQAQAELAAVQGIGPATALLLQRAGVSTIEELAHADPIELHARAKKARAGEAPLRGIHVAQERVDEWIHAARGHGPRATRHLA